MVEAISPRDIAKQKSKDIPDTVLETWNRLLAKEFNVDSGLATITQPKIIGALIEAGIERAKIFSEHYLDIEPIYEEKGWDVQYHKMHAWAGDTGDSYFVFKPSKA